MSCAACEESDEYGQVAYYRWGAANIGILACEQHATEVIKALNEVQNEKYE